MDQKQAPITLNLMTLLAPVFAISRAKGDPYCKLQAKNLGDNDKVITVMAFGETSMKLKDLKINTKIMITGKWNEKEADVFMMWGVYEPGKKTDGVSFLMHEARDMGSVKAYRQERDERFKRMEEAGLVPLFTPHTEPGVCTVEWLRKEDCVFHKEAWVRKIEYVMGVLGVDVVRTGLRALTKNGAMPKLKSGMSKIEVPWADAYKAWLDKKMIEVLFKQQPEGELFP